MSKINESIDVFNLKPQIHGRNMEHNEGGMYRLRRWLSELCINKSGDVT